MRHGYEDAGSSLAGVAAAGVLAGAVIIAVVASTEHSQETAPSAHRSHSLAAGRSAVASVSPSATAPGSESAPRSPSPSPTDVQPTFPSYSLSVPSVTTQTPESSSLASPIVPAPETSTVVPPAVPSKVVTAPKPAVPGPIIALDPGHSGTAIAVTDPISHLRTNDYENIPEIDEMFSVATMVEKSLQHDGYRVVMLKKHAHDTVSLSARAINAMKAHANLAVSIHDDHSQPYGQGNDVYPQKVGLYREKPDGSDRYTCNNAQIARLSQHYSTLMAAARHKSQGLTIDGGPSDINTSYLNRSGLYPGNLGMVQLTTCNGGTVGGQRLKPVPWVYNEMGAKRDRSTALALTHGMLVAYAQGITAGIEAAVPIKG